MGNGSGEQGMNAICESVGLLAGIIGIRFAEDYVDIVVSVPAEIGEAADDRPPMPFHQTRHYDMLTEQVAQGAVTTGGNIVEGQRRLGRVQHCIVRTGNRIGVESMLETKVGYLPAVFSPPPFRNRLGFAHSALIPSCANW